MSGQFFDTMADCEIAKIILVQSFYFHKKLKLLDFL